MSDLKNPSVEVEVQKNEEVKSGNKNARNQSSKYHNKKFDSKQTSESRPKTEKVEGSKKSQRKGFEYPENWKDDILKTLTSVSKIPEFPNDDELLKKPNFDELMRKKNNLNKTIDDIKIKIEAKNGEMKEARSEAINKNHSIFETLKTLREAKKVINDEFNKNKELKQAIHKEMDEIDTQKSKLVKNFPNGELIGLAELESKIKDKEMFHRNNPTTATQEQKIISEIKQLKSNMSHVKENENLKNKKKELSEKLKPLKAKGDEIYTKLKEVNNKIKAQQEKLELDNENKKTEKKDVNEDDKKPKRELSEKEKIIKAQIDSLYDDIRKLKIRIKEVSDKFDSDYLEYEKQSFEITKINFMLREQKHLRYEENKKKREEEKIKEIELAKQRAIEQRKLKYKNEIDNCNNLILVIEHLVRKRDAKVNSKQGVELVEVKIDESLLQKQGLIYVPPKKKEVQGVQPGEGRKRKQKEKKREIIEEDPDILNLDIDSVANLIKLKIQVPKTFSEVPETLKSVNEKKLHFYKLTEEEMNKKEEKEIEEEKIESKTEEVTEEVASRKDSTHSKRKKTFTEGDFPELS